MPRKDVKHYWPDRIQEANERNLTRTQAQTAKELNRIYKEQTEEIRLDILDAFEKIQRDAGTEHGIMINDLYRTNRYWTLLDTLNKRLNKLGKQQLTITEQSLIDTYTMAQQIIEKYVPKEIVQTSFLVPNAMRAEDVVRQCWVLDGKEFSDRIWVDKQKMLADLTKSMADNVQRGVSPWELAKGVAKRMDTSQYNAFRLMKTETAHAQIKAQTDKYREMGFTQGKYLGTNCCDDCKEMNGKIFPLDELESLIPHHPNCTCAFTLII